MVEELMNNFGRQGHLFENKGESTDLALMVDALAQEERSPWDASRIRDALIIEAGTDPATAEGIALEVEDDLLKYGRSNVTTSIIREMVNVKLFQRGLEAKLADHSRIGLPVHDLETMMFNKNKENSNTSHNPESINLSIAEMVLKEHALTKVFSKDVADAHLKGDIHLHDLGMVNRPYCSGQSVAYTARYGLNIPSITSVSNPAKHADVLLAHMLKMTSVLQNHFAGAIGWDAVNMYFAPYTVGWDYDKYLQLAQQLIFEFNQLAGGRGGQVAFTDVNLYYEIPNHFRDVPAIGPGGKFTGKTYSEYDKESKMFLRALFDVYMRGDSRGQPFFFPKPLLHITDYFFKEEGWEECLDHACRLSSEKGNTYYVFDRGGVAKLSECCRLSFELTPEDLNEAKHPWKMRYCALQNITLNLPRAAYKANGDDGMLFDIIDEEMELAAKAHLQKRAFIKNILDLGVKGPLAALCVSHDDEPYLRMRKASHLIGILGLNEMVQAMTGAQLHESEEAETLGRAVIQYMDLKCQQLSERYGLKIVLEQTPAESTALRFAKLDLRAYPEIAKNYIKGNFESGEIYYTNSTHLNYKLVQDPIDKVTREGELHPMIKAGAITHVWMGEHKPDPKALASFVMKTFRHTENAQVAFSPEFTICNECSHMERGLSDHCELCGSEDVDGITRVTGYFTRTSSWNAGKRGELKDRARRPVEMPA
ncbi:anaerobic ribonucleoside-triphosphate reductase [Cloacibacillus evryensis]|uniref:anaerobic ribonucleoside-triphosphate reductase n=1 Tax=Cloacibacillus evryensis TaxID=508460 RepID=UPI0026E020DB|nr:anaerobic ribonucleoside-triphosphate reductase [Cloacibacillus evryensis]